MSVIRKVGCVPPILELAGVMCSFFSLQVEPIEGLKLFGKSPIVISVSIPWLGWVGLALVAAGLIFQAVIEIIRNKKG